MNKNEVKISTKELAHWMNAVRNLDSHKERSRALDALWSGQLESKAWLVNHLKDYVMKGAPNNIYIFGGWIGLLASMMRDSGHFNSRMIYSIDIDPWCERIAYDANKQAEIDGQFKAVTADMAEFEYSYQWRPDIVINTSTEHVPQEVYDDWYNEIPQHTLVVIQGNNYFDCDEHVRCSNSLDEFMRQNKVSSQPYFKGELKTDMYTRYMCIWRKECF